MSAPIPLFVELCAGTAALSLRLHRDGARPPVSRMGAKTGYADTILRIIGLTPGQRAAAYLWCEPDPGVRLLLHAYRDAALARAAAAIIRSWAAEDPRTLWVRLRAEGPPRLPEGAVEAGEVARWAWTSNAAFRKGHPESGYNPKRAEEQPAHATGGRQPALTECLPPRFDALSILPATIAPDARLIDPGEVARWAVSHALTGMSGGYDCASERAARGERWGGDVRDFVPRRLLSIEPLPATIAPDAREVDPREVARAVITGQWAYRRMEPASGWCAVRVPCADEPIMDGDRKPARNIAADVDALGTIPAAAIAPDARTIDPPTLPPGTVCYMDPPYVATTGYAHDLPRAEVVALARRWAAAGAIVAISEAEPIPELVAEGWHAVRIDAERVGNKRTFSKQQAEWLTLSQPPAWVPAVQASLFGGAP